MSFSIIGRLSALVLGIAAVVPAASEAEQGPRARDLGIEPGVLSAGPLNAITDVAGVRVGHRTIIEGESVRTGVTAILPHDGNLFQRKVPAAVHVGNGSGDFVIAFSTSNTEPYAPERRMRSTSVVENDHMSPLFLATVEAVEEAVYNSLTVAETVTGFNGHSVEALPIERVREILRVRKDRPAARQ